MAGTAGLARLWPIFEVADARNAPEYGGTSDFWSVPGATGTVQKFPSTSEMPAKWAHPLDQNWPKSSLEHFPEKWIPVFRKEMRQNKESWSVSRFNVIGKRSSEAAAASQAAAREEWREE